MKIQKVIFTIDDNPHYKMFWRSISRHFSDRLGFHTKLFVIGDDNTDLDEYQSLHGDVEFVRKVGDIPTIIQALIGKFYFTTTELETTWLIGDLDLYPLQTKLFTDRISKIEDDKYVHLNPYGIARNWRTNPLGIPGYYHVAKGITFRDELKLNCSFEEVCRLVYDSKRWGIMFHGLNHNLDNARASKDYGWFCCEEMFSGEMLRYCDKIVEVDPGNHRTQRIDREDVYGNYNLDKLKSQLYIDLHAPRPYEDHSEAIEKIISIPFD